MREPDEERISKGRAAVAEAITKENVEMLKRCIGQFLAIGASARTIADALADCPLSLLDKTGYGIRIESAATGGIITLGIEIPWHQVADMVRRDLGKGDVAKVFGALAAFGGTVASVAEDVPASAMTFDDSGDDFEEVTEEAA